MRDTAANQTSEPRLEELYSQLFTFLLHGALMSDSYEILTESDLFADGIDSTGLYSAFIRDIASRVHIDDKNDFFDRYSPEALVTAHVRGQSDVFFEGRMLGADNVWHWVKTGARLSGKSSEADIRILFSVDLADSEKIAQVKAEETALVLAAVAASCFMFIALVETPGDRYELKSSAQGLTLPSFGDYTQLMDVLAGASPIHRREEIHQNLSLRQVLRRLKSVQDYIADCGEYAARFRFISSGKLIMCVYEKNTFRSGK